MSKLTTQIKLTLLALLAISPSLAQGTWGEPVSIQDFYLVINAIRTRPKVYAERVRQIFRDRRAANGTHNDFTGRVYTDTRINSLISYFDNAQSVDALALDRGLTAAAYEHATYMGSINNVNGLNSNNQNLDNRVSSWGNHTGGLGEAQMISFPGGKTAEITVLDYMLQSDANRDVIRNPNWNVMGIGIHKRINDYFVDVIFANSFICTRCHEITDKMEDEMHWNQYMRETYNPPDTDGNLRVHNRAISIVVGVFVTGFAISVL